MAVMGESGGRFFAARSISLRAGSSRLGKVADTETELIMKADLVKAASAVITNQQILVNMVSRRVRQLCLGHRPMVEFVPGLGHADIALSEIATGKLIFESTLGQNGNAASAEVVQFPGIIVAKKASPKKKAA
jgi:DNA-directed RNA polymerase subunit omega